LTGIESPIVDLEFSPDGRYLAVCSMKKGLIVFDTSSWKGVVKLGGYRGKRIFASFSIDGRLATVCDDGKIRLYNANFRLLRQKELSDAKIPIDFAFSPKGQGIAVGFADRPVIQVLDSNSLSILYRPNMKGVGRKRHLGRVCWSRDGSVLFAGGNHIGAASGGSLYQIRMWKDEGRGAYRDFTVASSAIQSLEGLSDGSIIFAGLYPDLGRIDRNGGRLFYKKAEILDFSAREKNHLRLRADGLAIGFGSLSIEQHPFSFSIVDRRLDKEPAPYPSPQSQGGGVKLTKWRGSDEPQLNGRKLRFLKRLERSQSVAVSRRGDRIIVGANWFVYCLNRDGALLWKARTPGVAWAVNIAEDAGICVAACGDGIIRWYRLSDGSELLALLVHSGGRRWVAWTPSGYYDCSPGGQDLVGWYVNNGFDQAADIFSVGRFSRWYYRPDIIPRVIELVDEKRAVEEANRHKDIDVAAKAIPDNLPAVVTIVAPEHGTSIKDETVMIKVDLRAPAGDPISEIKVLVNGRPIREAVRGFRIGDRDRVEGESSYEVPVEEGVNIISVIAKNRSGWSEPSSVKVIRRRSGRPKPDQFLAKPTLYILAVGVSRYSDTDMNLQYPSKDAEDFVQIMELQKEKLYKEVIARILVDEGATKNRVLEGLEWIERETTVHDIAMIFVAGHGMNDNRGRLYYLPYEADTERLKSSALPAEEIADTIGNIVGKIVYFVDTCHSGNIKVSRRAPALDVTGIVNELSSAENGAVVYCSSSGNQYSLESEEWKNGAFTKALVDGLKGNADYTDDGTITVNELDLYITETVKSLTAGKQTPVTAKPDTIRDFPVTILDN
jgi:hypothetical protein